MVQSSVKLKLEDFTGGKVRSAFPAYRVFVFGQEVTRDVVEVRVNHSGGSAERSAGTCSFTLVNPDDKYTLTFGDMLLIGESAAAYREKRKDQWVNNGFGGTTPLEVQKLQQYAEMWEEANTLSTDEETLIAEYTQLGKSDEIPQELLDKAKKIDENTVENKQNIEDTYRDLAESMTKASYAVPFSALNLDSFSADAFGPNTIKAEVITEKLNFSSEVVYNPNSNLAKLEDRTLMQYPFSQGDCIFHPNDPVRVAFRDPFDPRVWYWMFAGFVDAWTENSGVNKDSVITLNCTDVTKMARYSYVQIGTGLQDPNIEDIFTQIDPATQASKQVQYFKQLFANFTMLEVLDTLFFGTDSAQITAEDIIRSQVTLMSDEALAQYLSSANSSFIDPNSPGYLWAGDADATRKLRIDAVTQLQSIQRLKAIEDAGKFPPLCIPAPYMKGVEKGDATTNDYNASAGTIVAKKKSDARGVHAYFYGGVTAQDEAYGEALQSLHWWNELIHHRVRARDLVDMALNSSLYSIPTPWV